MSDERQPCPRCNRIGLRDGSEWFCLAHGTYGITLYGWDSYGSNGGVDVEEYAQEFGKKRHAANYIPIIPWSSREIEEWRTWREGDPLPPWAQDGSSLSGRDRSELDDEIVRLKSLGMKQLQIALELSVETSYVSSRLRALRKQESTR